MQISEQDSARLAALFHQMQNRPDRNNEYPDYKDLPALHEMAARIRPYAAKLEEADADTLTDIAAVCRFLGEQYRWLGRGVYAAEFLSAAFHAAVAGAEPLEDAGQLFADAVRARNYYVDDDCEDLKQRAATVLDETTLSHTFASASKRTMKRDPVEMTPEYLAVIDEVEEKVAEEMTAFGRGSCHHRWAMLRDGLAEKGVYWRSPAVMNPRWRFD